MHWKYSLLGLAQAAAVVLAVDSAVVDLSLSKGSPQHLASGFIYGIPDTYNQVQSHWYTDMGFRYNRAGGAQLEAPCRGWIWGYDEYLCRLHSTLSNYRTTREYGGSFIILPHDVWGTDHANDSTVWPGDDGDWTNYDLFVTTLLADMAEYDALDALVWDTWNEPDETVFWARSAQQWVDLFVRTSKIIRDNSKYDGVQITGPSLATAPSGTDDFWTLWLSQVEGNDTVPDQYSYHLEADVDSPDDDLQITNATLTALLAEYGLPARQVNINEYATFPEQFPAPAAWWISRLERYETLGLRGNWMDGLTLHDLFANLLTKIDDPYNYTATDYAAAPEWQVYRYYNTNMTGHRVNTTGTADRLFDVYATVDSDKVRILSGTRITEGTWAITVNGMTAVGLPAEGTVDIQTWGFAGTDHFAVTGAPSNRGIVAHTYANDTLVFPIYQTDTTTAWAFEFSRG
ncbi:hypothetical protein ASPZODRAFT_76619 [Penicilliopsis zonata CBS 506.65]|uniref:Beta-xylosidase C-terminal Concanavalin A-like domain-containing protein n=1 Tax=Penicilliopsis zonata CBS 506.65 TaxID=1073090 RepID=A0A1L9S5W5_9EURO|nr:hypothetical protein ASPZODRAFT_76619 [Penicilliopsis zonata CBS 506.65]OJJ42551.1 hypothetical protein ASPZODRAFT_76619 [Penicilliopsis zonata CBS 506.65]